MSTLINTTIASDRPTIFTQLTIASIALLAITVLWGQYDVRMLDGVSVWVKPAKFALSFTVHFATLAIIVAALSEQNRKHLGVAIAGGVLAIAYLAEMAYIFFQAAQAEHSHFNFSTPFHQTMYSLMGVGAVLLIAMPVVVAWFARRDSAIGPATRAGIWWGALTSFFLTLATAGYLADQGGHFVGVPTDPSRVLPIVGWSTEVGDLRPAHFLSLHALQLLPLIGLWIDRTSRSVAIIKPLAAVYALLSVAVLAQALMGLPLISI